MKQTKQNQTYKKKVKIIFIKNKKIKKKKNRIKNRKIKTKTLLYIQKNKRIFRK